MIDIQYIRTSTLLLRWDGLTILTDPWFAMQMRGLPVFVRPCVRPAQLPPLDLVLVSHMHPDHFDRRALGRLSFPCKLLVGPPQLRRRDTRGLPVERVVQLRHGERIEEPQFTLWAHSVEHSGYENAYVLRRNGESLLFAGDANYSAVFEAMGRQHTPQVSLLPVGGTLALGRRIVMSPEDALAAAVDLRTSVVVPIHLGGEWASVPPLSFHPGRAFHLQAVARLHDAPFQVAALRPGEHLQVEQGSIICGQK